MAAACEGRRRLCPLQVLALRGTDRCSPPFCPKQELFQKMRMVEKKRIKLPLPYSS